MFTSACWQRKRTFLECFIFFKQTKHDSIAWQPTNINKITSQQAAYLVDFQLSVGNWRINAFTIFSRAVIIFTLTVPTFYLTNSQSIIRGDNNIFTKKAACRLANAVCLHKENCTNCQCEKGDQTFVRARGRYGECIPNKFLAYVTCEYL